MNFYRPRWPVFTTFTGQTVISTGQWPADHCLCSSRKNPYLPCGRSLEIASGKGVLKAKFLEAMCENKLEIPEGGWGAKQKTYLGGSMDIVWNCTLYTKIFRTRTLKLYKLL